MQQHSKSSVFQEQQRSNKTMNEKEMELLILVEESTISNTER